MNIKLLTLPFAIALTACTPVQPKWQMIYTMEVCSANNPTFVTLVNCTKEKYNANGVNPSAPEVQSFYAQIDGVVEEVKAKKINDIQAKAQYYKIYDSTVGAGNAAMKARQKSCIYSGGIMLCD